MYMYKDVNKPFHTKCKYKLLNSRKSKLNLLCGILYENWHIVKVLS